ncbi:MAG: glycosyltransferase [Bacteroidota bacterium]
MIVIVGPAAPFRGGIAHFSNRLSQALAERGDQVRLLTFTRQYPEVLFPGKTQFEEADAWELPAQPVRMIDSIGPGTWREAGEWIAAQRPDVVVFVHWLPFFVPAYLGVMKAMENAGVTPHISLLMHNVLPHKRFPFTRPLMRSLGRRVDSFVTLSDKVTGDLNDLLPNAPALTSFHPIYDHYQPPVPASDARREIGLTERPTLLFFGLVRPYKGLDVLIDAMPGILEQMDAQLIVAGEFYENEEEYRAHVDRLNLGDHVRFDAEYIPNERVHWYFSAADLVVQPYRRAVQSGVTQTAFYFGKPAVVTNLGVLCDMVPDGEAGYTVPPENPERLGEAVIHALRAGPEAFTPGVARQRERYSWTTLARQITEFWAQRQS